MKLTTRRLLLATLGTGALLTYPGFSGETIPELTPVDLELSLAIDVSGSVSDFEFEQQLNGYSSAFRNPQVVSSIESIGTIAVNAIFFDDEAVEGVPFFFVSNSAESISFADALDAYMRVNSGGTAPAAGIDLATNLLGTNQFEGSRVVIDVSGDGTGIASQDSAARDAALANGVDTINGLPIPLGPGDTIIEDYYRDNIIGGDGAFVNPADDFDDFERAVLQKLIAEITGVGIGGLSPLTPAIRNIEVLAVNSGFGDLNARLLRLRTGFRAKEVAVEPSYTAPSAKGGLSSKETITPATSYLAADRWEVFGSIGYTTSDFETQDGGPNGLSLPGYDADLLHGTVGLEYDFNRNFSLGVAVIGTTGDIDLTDGSDIDVDRYGFAIYGSYYREIQLAGSPASFYADLLYGYSEGDYDIDRRLNGNSIDGSTDTDSNLIQFNTGLSFRNGAIQHGPTAGLFYQTGEIDSFDENGLGGLSNDSEDIDSFRLQLGYQASYTIASSAGDIIPQLRAAWEHEFEDDGTSVGGFDLGEPDTDIAVLGASVIWQFHPSAYATVDYEARLGNNQDSHSVRLLLAATF